MLSDPIKILWKYKNNNRRIQYNTYIYIGDIPKELYKILESIQEYNLYETLTKISKSDNSILEKYYGEQWYKFFFNSYHINHIISNIRQNNIQKKQLIDKYGKDWYNLNIENGLIKEKKILYSYESLIKSEVDRKTQKQRNIGESLEDEEFEKTDIDYKISIKNKIDDIIYKTSKDKSEKSTIYDIKQFGGKAEENNEIENNNDSEDDEITENPFAETHLQDELLDEDEELDLAEIEQLYKDSDVDPDNQLSKTTELIKNAIDDNKLFDKRDSTIIKFDDSEDNVNNDIQLKDVYNKFYVKSQYINKDDTIKTLKNKILCSIKNNSKYEKISYVIPSKMYLWSEYMFNNKIEKVMMGQKWLRKNELLSIDVEPNNNIKVYEDLIGNLKNLRDNIRRYGNRIRREDDENKLIYDYDSFYTNNEIYMIDLYNELGQNYQAANEEQIRNLGDIYLKLYFPKVKPEDLKQIIDYLNKDIKVESEKNEVIYNTIYNDLVMENEIMEIINNVKNENKNSGSIPKYKKIFKENFITQALIHLNLKYKDKEQENPSKLLNNYNIYNEKRKIDLFRIFNEFVPTEKYPFIQYQTNDGQIIFKYKEDDINEYIKIKENKELLSKWFENAPYGISFKVKIIDNKTKLPKFMAVGLNDQGRIEYKTQWKEDNNATLDDITYTYRYIKELLEVLNKQDNKLNVYIPENDEFKFAFINTIQKFELPENFIINHNDLSEFSRYFYPYVALQINPRKRLSGKSNTNTNDKTKHKEKEEVSKFGTYLRYKRVSGYENSNRIEQRIYYLMRNYEYTESQLIDEIAKQFNITEDKSIEEIEKVKQRYPVIKKTKRILKKLENLPKYKPPGIDIDIQGKSRDNYKIRVSGARDKYQLERILSFLNIFIYLYVETYLYKKPERQELKEKLKKLNNIAKRRGKVDLIQIHEKESLIIKKITSFDKQRLGFKPTDDQNQWSRCCQNSGKDKRRRPQQYSTKNPSELLKDGYKLNKKNNEWEKIVELKNKKTGVKEKIVLSTLKLPEFDEDGNLTGNDIHYGCSPEDNGEHMYVGFLTKCINPNGHCMPCCFKKNIMDSVNNKKKEFYKKCAGDVLKNKNKDNTDELLLNQDNQDNSLDKLYILQDTNKIQLGRFGFLPKYLDFFLNTLLNKEAIIKQHYLSLTKNSYIFKFGVDQEEDVFMNCISFLFEKSKDSIIKNIINIIENDKNEQIFNSLNNGDIKLQFQTKENYINYLKYNELDFNIINNILSIPGVLTKNGLNIVLFKKNTTIIKESFDKEIRKDDFFILCQNPEDKFSIKNSTKDTILLLNEGNDNKNYYPLVSVNKIDENKRNIDVKKTFKFQDTSDNIINHILDFYYKNCINCFTNEMLYKNKTLNSIDTYHLFNSINKDYNIKSQFIDTRYKCKYFITNNNLIIPVRSSGSLYNIPIIKSTNLDKFKKSFKDTYKYLTDITELINKKYYKPKAVYYDITKNDKYNIIAIYTEYNTIIPIENEFISKSVIDKLNLKLINKSLDDYLDDEIIKGRNNFVIDKRILDVNFDKFESESYELFRLEFSNFLISNQNIKETIINIIKNNTLAKITKEQKVKLILYKIIDESLYKKYKNSLDESVKLDKFTLNENKDKFVDITPKLPELINYRINNERELCEINNNNKNSCETNLHCKHKKDGCYLSLTKEMIIVFINKVAKELIEYDLKAFEILRIGDYFVSDIVDYNIYKEYPGQKIIKSNSSAIKKTLEDLFGKNKVFKIGRRKSNIKATEIDYQQLNNDNPPKYISNYIVQDIIHNNITLFRAYTNAYYWIKNNLFDDNTRNLGYYSSIQTDYANYFKSLIIDWIQNKDNIKEISEKLSKYIDTSKDNFADLFITKITTNVHIYTNCVIELYILNIVENIPILVFDDEDNLIYLFDHSKNIFYSSFDNKKTNNKEFANYINNRNNYINLRFSYISNNMVPDDIQVIYYK